MNLVNRFGMDSTGFRQFSLICCPETTLQ